MRGWKLVAWSFGWLAGVFVPLAAVAAPLTTTHYRLDPNVTASFGGRGSSTSYRLVGAGGEAAVGLGSSASYRLGAGYVRELQQSIQVAVLPGGVSLYYPLDTGVGIQAYDSSATGNTGVLQNTPTWSAGKISQGITLNGSSQYIATSTSYVSPSPFSIELWVKTATASGGQLAGFGNAATGASSTSDRHVYMTSAGRIVFGVNPGTQKTIITSGSYNDNTWHHVVATLGAGGMALYVDGVSAGTDPNTAAASLTGYWRFGYDSLTGWPSAPTSNYLAGSLDEIKVYSRALSSTEVAAEYAAGTAGVVSAQAIPQVTAGASQVAATDVVVRTDAGGYNLAISEDHDLRHTDATTTIAGIGTGSIGTPALWSEGTTKGLGFGLTAGTGLAAKWGTSPNYKYAVIPTSTTTFHTRTGLSGGAPDTTTMQLRLDPPVSQKSGKYTNLVTISATIVP